MVCTWFHAPTSQCCNAYCHYSRNATITCPIKKEYIGQVGEIYRESPGSETGRTAYTRYDPRHRGSKEDRRDDR